MMEANEMVRLRTCHGTWVGALADKRSVVQVGSPQDRCTVFAVVRCEEEGRVALRTALGRFLDLDRCGARLRLRLRPAAWTVVPGRFASPEAPPGLSALSRRGRFAAAAAGGGAVVAGDAGGEASLFFVEAARVAGSGAGAFGCKCAHARLPEARRAENRRAAARAWRDRRVLVALRGDAVRRGLGFHWSQGLGHLEACVLGDLRALGAARVDVFLACRAADGFGEALEARGFRVVGAFAPDASLAQWPAALDALGRVEAEGRYDAVVVARPDAVWTHRFGDWGVPVGVVAFPFREPWAGEGAACDVFHVVPTAHWRAFLAALATVCALPENPNGTSDDIVEAGRDVRAQQRLFAEVEGLLGPEAVTVVLQSGVYPSGEVGADNALHPNPLYALAGTFRAMCNRGRLGHVPMRRPPPDIANAPPPYALADMISGAWTAPGRRAGFLQTYPGSLAAEYLARAAKGCENPNFKGSYLGRFLLVLADFWTRDHLSERSRT